MSCQVRIADVGSNTNKSTRLYGETKTPAAADGTLFAKEGQGLERRKSA